MSPLSTHLFFSAEGLGREMNIRFEGLIEVPVYISRSSEYSNSISSNSSLLECLPVSEVTRIRLPAETCLSKGALVEDRDDFGQLVNSLHIASKIKSVLSLHAEMFFF